MNQITMCVTTNCKRKLTCFRFMQTPKRNQPVFLKSPLEPAGTCQFYLGKES